MAKEENRNENKMLIGKWRRFVQKLLIDFFPNMFFEYHFI